MPKYVIERKVPGVGRSSQAELQAMAQKSNEVLRTLGGEVSWQESYVTDDAIYCVYVAPNETLVKRHAEMAGFPADRVLKVDAVLDPSSGEIAPAPRMANQQKSSEQSMRQ